MVFQSVIFNGMNITDNAKKLGLKTALSYLEKDPEKNIPKLIGMIEKVAPKSIYIASSFF